MPKPNFKDLLNTDPFLVGESNFDDVYSPTNLNHADLSQGLMSENNPFYDHGPLVGMKGLSLDGNRECGGDAQEGNGLRDEEDGFGKMVDSPGLNEMLRSIGGRESMEGQMQQRRLGDASLINQFCTPTRKRIDAMPEEMEETRRVCHENTLLDGRKSVFQENLFQNNENQSGETLNDFFKRLCNTSPQENQGNQGSENSEESPGSQGSADLLHPSFDIHFLRSADQVEMKKARDPKTNFSCSFPDQMYTTYKYDLRISGVDTDIELKLFLAYEDGELIETSSKEGIVVSALKKYGKDLRIFRFDIKSHSFHHNKRKFRIKILQDDMLPKMVYMSSPFTTLARKQKKNRKPMNEENLVELLLLAQKKDLILNLIRSLPQNQRQDIIQLAAAQSNSQPKPVLATDSV